MVKNIRNLIGIFSVMIIAFCGTEYLTYIFYSKKSKLFIPCFILFLLMVSLSNGIMNKFIILPYKIIIVPIIVLFAVFISLAILKVTLPYL